MDYKKLAIESYRVISTLFWVFVACFIVLLANEYPHYMYYTVDNNETVIPHTQINWSNSYTINFTDEESSKGAPYLQCPPGPPQQDVKQWFVTRWFIISCEIKNMPHGDMYMKHKNIYIYWLLKNRVIVENIVLLLIIGSFVCSYITNKKESFIYKCMQYIKRVGDAANVRSKR
jgi:hypothetical protein